MSFKESLESDLEHVFFDTEEFAEECNWNTYKITAIIDDDDMIKKYSAEFETLGQGSHLVYASEKEFKKMPFINDAVTFNNNLYTINDIKDEMGMLVIFLNRGRG